MPGLAPAEKAGGVAAEVCAEYRVQHVFEMASGVTGGAVEDALGVRVGLDDGDAADADQWAWAREL